MAAGHSRRSSEQYMMSNLTDVTDQHSGGGAQRDMSIDSCN